MKTPRRPIATSMLTTLWFALVAAATTPTAEAVTAPTSITGATATRLGGNSYSNDTAIIESN